MRQPKSKESAIKKGLITYFDGSVCRQGHKGLRYVSGDCVKCAKDRAKKRYPIENKKRRLKTKEKLKSIIRICKRRLCDNQFTPKTRSDQVFCSERCADIQGKEDWKKRNEKKYRNSENIRKRNKYKNDEKYKKKQKQKRLSFYHSMTDEEKYIFNKIRREKEDPLKRKKYHRNYQNQRNKHDLNHRLSGSLRARVRAALKSQNSVKSFKTMSLIGCTINQLWSHLENKFKPGMSRKNYGKWHVDHIIPISKFNLKDQNQQKICFNYLNLQPLWKIENLRKSNK